VENIPEDMIQENRAFLLEQYKKGKKKEQAPEPTIAAARSVSGNHGVGRENVPVSRSVSTSRIHAIM